MIKGLMLLADGFEGTEAIGTHDILTRTHEIDVTYLSISDHLNVISSMGLEMISQGLLGDMPDFGSYDFLVIPGGKLGVENIKKSSLAMEAIKKFHNEGKKIFAICAGPSILGELGYLDGKKYTCFPGFQCGKGTYLETGAVVDGNIITGHSMYYTVEFAEAIVRNLLGEEGIKTIYPGTRGAKYPR